MAEEQFRIPVCYRVEIGQELPEQRESPNTPRWEAFVEIPDEVRRTVKAKNLSLQWHAMELARTAIGRLRLVNDPQFTPRARLAQRVDFDAVRKAYSEVDFTFPHFITEDNCRIWFLRHRFKSRTQDRDPRQRARGDQIRSTTYEHRYETGLCFYRSSCREHRRIPEQESRGDEPGRWRCAQ